MESSSGSGSSDIPEDTLRTAPGTSPRPPPQSSASAAAPARGTSLPEPHPHAPPPRGRSNPLAGAPRATGPPEAEVRVPITDDSPDKAPAPVVESQAHSTPPAITETPAATNAEENTVNVKEKKDVLTLQLPGGNNEGSNESLVSQLTTSSSLIATEPNSRQNLFQRMNFSNYTRPQTAGILHSVPSFSRDVTFRNNKSSDILPDSYSTRVLFDPIDAVTDTVFLSVSVLGMTQLHADPSVVHPFVRVWLLNGTTGESLLVPVEGCAPFALTHPVDIRLRRTRAPWWGAELFLRLLPCAMKTESNAVLLLEVLDTCNESLQGYRLRSGGLYPVCWGFVKIHDMYDRPNFRERMHVEMFPFPHRVSLFTRALQQLLPFSLSSDAVWAEAKTPKPPSFSRVLSQEEAITFSSAVAFPSSSLAGEAPTATATETFLRPPNLFYIYRDARNRKLPYGAGITITVKSVKDSLYQPRETVILPYEEYLLNELTLVTGEPLCRGSLTAAAAIPMERRTRNVTFTLVNAAALGSSYLRKPSERVLPPAQILQQMQIKGRVTCVAFSHNTALLAMGVTTDFQHVVQLRNSLEREMHTLSICRGHEGHIHHVAFRSDAQLLLSCSSDKTVRVWQLDCPVHGPGTNVSMQLYCLCKLPHDFPVYCAIFYQKHIITCGFDPRLFVWCYDRKFSDELTELDSIVPDAYHRKAHEVIPVDSTSPAEVQIPIDSTEPFLGQLVSVTTENNKSPIYAICATELKRVCSVDAAGNVVIWRATCAQMEGGKSVWQLSSRHRFKCQGATRVEICGSQAFVTCAKTAVVYLFDVAAYRLVREISLHQRPYLPAVTLLPDGEAFIAATGDGRLLSWECSTGALCTSSEGYAEAQVQFAAARIAWANSEQVGALVGNKGTAGYTPIAIIGTPRKEASVIKQSNPQAPDMFRAQFGGGIATSQRWNRSSLTNTRQRRVLVKETAEGGGFESFLSPRESFSSDKRTRMGQIISLWKGLARRHYRATGGAEDRTVGVRGPAAKYAVSE